jgi:hypothetical protein
MACAWVALVYKERRHLDLLFFEIHAEMLPVQAHVFGLPGRFIEDLALLDGETVSQALGLFSSDLVKRLIDATAHWREERDLLKTRVFV